MRSFSASQGLEGRLQTQVSSIAPGWTVPMLFLAPQLTIKMSIKQSRRAGERQVSFR
jgi:hypothetical protein